MASLISNSQVLITGGNFQQSIKGSKDPFDRLLEATSPTAFHDSDDVHDPPKCHPNTRVAVLTRIMDWIHGADPEIRNALIMWLYGPAGSGKSAIARSIAELCASEGILVASYFFSRFDLTRNHGRSLIATIAYQVSLCFPETRAHIAEAIAHDPFIFSRSLSSQISSLITGPLQERIEAGYFNTPNASRIIIIDGLDECVDRDSQIKILDAISRAFRQHSLPLIFFIASRPEPDIRTAFCFGHLSEISTRNPLDDDYSSSEDIRLFLRDKFAEIQDSHPFRAQIPLVWPSEDALRTIVDKASGQFIYASTIAKFIQSTRHRPPQRLEIILGIRPAQLEMPFAELDALYMHIFLSVLDPEAAVQILALHLLSEFPYVVSDMEKLLSLDAGDIPVLLCDLTSLVSVEEGESLDEPGSVLHVFHASLADFLFDTSRSKQFWINAPLRHAKFAVLHLKDIPGFIAMRYNFLFHIQGAAPTLELQENITKSSAISYLAEQEAYALIPKFFTTISQWNFDGSTGFYNEQLRCFDHFAKGVLASMYADSCLAALVSIVKLEISNGGILFELFSLSKTQKCLDKLSFSFWAHFSPSYRRFILKFLKDPRRSGIYAFTGERYAAAAVYFIKYITNHPEQILPSLSTLKRKHIRRMKTPWLWRQMVQKTHSSEAVQTVQWSQLPRNRRRLHLPWSNILKSDRAFGLALKCLAHVLPQSAISEELTILAAQYSFGPLWGKRPNRKKAVKQEIARYLARAAQESY